MHQLSSIYNTTQISKTSSMEALLTHVSPLPSLQFSKPILMIKPSIFTLKPPKSLTTKSKFTTFTSLSASPRPENLDVDDKFEWFCEWYPVMPVCDLDKRAPVGKKVMGVDVVVWWDRNENAWKVFDDKCPHRLAPLSEGRIDERGRLQCVYHGWCFGGSGDCELVPQAPPDGPPVHSFKKACVSVYPSIMQNGIVWFWPNTDPQYKDIVATKKPPYIPELDDPSFAATSLMFNRDIPYGYEILIENLMDPSHVPYAHHGIMTIAQVPSAKLDREGGSPIDIINVSKIDKNGFTSTELPDRKWKFVPPCLLLANTTIKKSPNDKKEKLMQKSPRIYLFIFFCIPVSPGKSRLISAGPRNFSLWMDPLAQRWMHHIMVNLVIDSDLYLLQVQEEKLMEAGPLNWQNVCFLPTKADANVVAFRKWLKKYADGQVNWGTKFAGYLPSTLPREQLMDRYWSHVVNCSSCKGAYEGLNALQIFLEVFSVSIVAVMTATKQRGVARNALTVAAIVCFVGSKWLSSYIYKNFHFHDYNHAFK